MGKQETSSKRRRIRFKAGDVFYIPLTERKNLMPELADGSNGEYIPLPDDIIAFGQILLNDKYSTISAVFDFKTTQSEVDKIKIGDILEKEVIFMYQITSSAFSRGWWPILGNISISQYMPFQAYQWAGKAYDHKEVFSEAYSKKETQKKAKVISKDIIQKLPIAGILGSPGILTRAAQYKFGLVEEFFPDLDIDTLKPKPEALVWKIFPDRYTDPYAK